MSVLTHRSHAQRAFLVPFLLLRDALIEQLEVGLGPAVFTRIGYDLGVLSPTIFTMMVLMALVTTFMTSPALSIIQHIQWKPGLTGAKSVPERL